MGPKNQPTTKTNREDMRKPDAFAVILVEPQLGENIGMVARAMLNCGIEDLRLIKPRDGWPSESARNAASGADLVIDGAQVFDTTDAAIADLDFILATTARPRDMTKTVFTPHAAAAELRSQAINGGKTGVLFGKESTGLHNNDVTLADGILTVPLNPEFTSLNLAQCVLLVCYEWYTQTDHTIPVELKMPDDTRPATKEELRMMYEHLESELDATGFLRVPEKRPIMVRNIRNMLGRANFTEKEVRSMRGIISALRRDTDEN